MVRHALDIKIARIQARILQMPGIGHKIDLVIRSKRIAMDQNQYYVKGDE